MQKHDFEIYRGDTTALDVELTDDSGAPFDMSGAQVAMLVVGDDGTTLSPQLTVDRNRIHILFAADSTGGMTWRRGKYDLQLTIGDTVMTVLRGNIQLVEDVTP